MNNAIFIFLFIHIGMKKIILMLNLILKMLFYQEGVDAILDGHTHPIYQTTSKGKNGKDIKIN